MVQEFAQFETFGLAADTVAGRGPVEAMHFRRELQQLAAGKFLVKKLLVGHVAQAAARLARPPRAIDPANAT